METARGLAVPGSEGRPAERRSGRLRGGRRSSDVEEGDGGGAAWIDGADDERRRRRGSGSVARPTSTPQTMGRGGTQASHESPGELKGRVPPWICCLPWIDDVDDGRRRR
jgi:hypothetical protein